MLPNIPSNKDSNFSNTGTDIQITTDADKNCKAFPIDSLPASLHTRLLSSPIMAMPTTFRTTESSSLSKFPVTCNFVIKFMTGRIKVIALIMTMAHTVKVIIVEISLLYLLMHSQTVRAAKTPAADLKNILIDSSQIK